MALDPAQSLPNELEIEPLRRQIDARLRLPGSKSYTNRALLLAALAHGTSRLEGALVSDDTMHMIDALKRFGFHLNQDGAESQSAEQNRIAPTESKPMQTKPMQIEVKGLGGHIPNAQVHVQIGNAGTAARFLTAMATLGRGEYLIDGDAAMRMRPIEPLLNALRELGSDASSITDTGCPPVRVRARGLAGGSAKLSGSVSSQYLSALLMVAPYSQHGVEIELLSELVSKPYVDLTIQAMQTFGVQVEHQGYRSFRVQQGQYIAQHYAIEPDASAASYFFALAAICNSSITVEGLGRSSLQGDLSFVHVLEQMGCEVVISESETMVRGTGQLRGINVDMTDCSDTAQTLAAIAPFASSPTHISGIGFIRHKETNRIRALVLELQKLGIEAIEEEDGLTIHPGKPRPGLVETYNDHRMAMSFSLIGLRTPGIRIANPSCVSKTFPQFFDVLGTLRSNKKN